MSDKQKLLGDRVATALAMIGITDERFSALIGKECKCDKRKEFLNRLDLWARRVISGKTEDAKEHLKDIVDDNE